jgi:hypothetical protein
MYLYIQYRVIDWQTVENLLIDWEGIILICE